LYDLCYQILFGFQVKEVIIMAWSEDNYPRSMKNLSPRVREKAIEISNTLLDQGYEEGRAIAIGTSQAEQWAENRGIPIREEDEE
jgi:uncharacterized protein YdaT